MTMRTGWVCALLAAGVLAYAPRAEAQATGGEVSDVVIGGVLYRVHTFTNSAVSSEDFVIHAPIANVEYLIVGGGGGGGASSSTTSTGLGGGGGGDFVTDSIAQLQPQTIVIRVGVGGTGGNSGRGENGHPSSISNVVLGAIVAIGGGGGGERMEGNGKNGGSGGGAGYGNDPLGGGQGGIGTGGNGNNGGNHSGVGAGTFGGAGGGGAGAVGSDNNGNNGGDGGNGLESSISGSTETYASGGGGGGGAVEGAAGGSGGPNAGNGAGGGTKGAGGNAPDNFGGGGGGACGEGHLGGSGGSGIVIVRYVADPDLPQIANVGVTDHMDTSVDIVGSLASNGVNAASVTLYWATTDYTTNATDWVTHGGSTSVGPYADGETFTNTVSGLSANTVYYWNHRAVNASGTVWAASSVSPSFKTLGPPSVDNGVGATIVRATTARLNGTLLDGAPAHVFLSWWADGSGTTNVVDLGLHELAGGVFANLTGLTPATAYSYRTWASNDYGTVWAPAASGFTTRIGPYYVALNGAAPNDGASWATAFTSVQEAIDFASDGETIYLKGETFTLPANHANGKLAWSGKGLTIDGGYAADGGTPGARTNTATVLRNTTTISYAVSAADTANRVLYASSVTNGTLRNVTLRGGTVRNAFGANVYMTGCTNLLMDAVTIESGHQWQYDSGTARGGGVYALNSWGAISNSIIQHNTIAGQWGTYLGHGIYLAGGGWTLRDSIIRNNRDTSTAGSSTYRGMGLYIQSGTHHVQNCLIARNFCENFTSGSGVYVEGGSLTMQNATVFWHPVSGIQRAAGSVMVRDSIVWANGANLVGTITRVNSAVEGLDSAAAPQFERGFFLAPSSPYHGAGSMTVDEAGLTGYTVRADGTADSGNVALGYHFPPGTAAVDYYVDAVNGLDSNTGLAPGAAFKTITKALSVIGNGSRVNVAAGTYNVANGETFPLSVNNRYGVQILGAGRDTTIIDANTAANRRCMNMTYIYPDATISGLTFKRGSLTSGVGGGLYLANVQGYVTDVAITDNAITTSNWGAPAGGGLYAIQCAVTVSNCIVARNTLTPWYPESSYGGGIFASGAASGPLTILNSTIVSNVTSVGGGAFSSGQTAFGGGLYISGNATIRNSLITHNDARSTTTTGKTPAGDAAYIAGGTVVFENCTVVTNHPVAHGRGTVGPASIGIQRGGGTVTVNNSILWGSGMDALGAMTVNWSNVGEVGATVTTNNCISADPRFVDVAAGNYRLNVKSSDLSPSVNAGNPEAADWMLTGVDLDGNARILNKRVDQGAYENVVPPAGTLILLR